MKLESNGNIIWSNIYIGTSFTDIGYDIIQLNDTGLVISSYSRDIMGYNINKIK